MSHPIDDLSPWTIDRIAETLASAITQTPADYQPIGRALARAIDRYLDASFLASYGDADEAACLMNFCRRDITEALTRLDTEHPTVTPAFAQAASRLGVGVEA